MDILDPLHLEKLPTRTSRNWSDDIKQRAVAAYVSGTRITDISKKLNVPRRTLRHWITNNEDRQRENGKTRKSTLLTQQQENELFERMQRLSELCHYNLSKEDLQKIAFDYCLEREIPNNFLNGRANPKWLNGFLSRNKHLGEVYFEKANGDGEVLVITDYEDDDIDDDSHKKITVNNTHDENSLSNGNYNSNIPDDSSQPYYSDYSSAPSFYQEEPSTMLSPIQELQLVNRIQNYSLNGILTKNSLVELTRKFFKENHVVFMHENAQAEKWVDEFMARYKTELGQYSDNEDVGVSTSDDNDENSLKSNSVTENSNNSPIHSLKRLHKKRISSWNEMHMRKALADLKRGAKVLPTSRKYNIPRQTLSYRWEKEQKGEAVTTSTPIAKPATDPDHYSLPYETVELPGPGKKLDYNNINSDDNIDDSESQYLDEIKALNEATNSLRKSIIQASTSFNTTAEQCDVIDLLESSDDDYDEGDETKSNSTNLDMSTSHTRGCRWDYDIKLKVVRCIKEGLSLKEAAQRFNIPVRTIRNWSKDNTIITSPVAIHHNKFTVLTYDQEMELINRIKNMHNGEFLVSKQEFLKYVFDYCEENKIKHPFKNGQPGKKWYTNFRTRHPEVSFKSSVDVYTPNELTAYYENLYNDEERSSTQTWMDVL